SAATLARSPSGTPRGSSPPGRTLEPPPPGSRPGPCRVRGCPRRASRRSRSDCLAWSGPPFPLQRVPGDPLQDDLAGQDRRVDARVRRKPAGFQVLPGGQVEPPRSLLLPRPRGEIGRIRLAAVLGDIVEQLGFGPEVFGRRADRPVPHAEMIEPLTERFRHVWPTILRSEDDDRPLVGLPAVAKMGSGS